MDKKPKGMMLMIGMDHGKPKDSMPSKSMPDDEPMPESGHDDEDDQPMAKNYDIDVPDGFEPPDDVQEGDQFDATVRCHMEDGKLCIDSINGIKTDGSDKTEGSETDKGTAPPEQKQPQSLDDAMKAQSSYKMGS